MPKVVVVGGLTIDHLVQEGLGCRFGQPGGPGLFGALGARLVAGTEVALLARVPADKALTAVLDDAGIDLSLTTRGGPAERAWLLTDTHGRMVVAGRQPGQAELLSAAAATLPSDISWPTGLRADGVLLSSPTQLPSGLEARVVGIDPHQTLIAQCGMAHLAGLSQATVFLPSRVHLRLLDTDEDRAARAIFTNTGVPVVARLDAQGMLIVDETGSRVLLDPAAHPVETTGAGDSSAAAIVAALAAGHPLDEAVRFGISVARIAISDWAGAGLCAASPLTRPFPEITHREQKEAS